MKFPFAFIVIIIVFFLLPIKLLAQEFVFDLYRINHENFLPYNDLSTKIKIYREKNDNILTEFQFQKGKTSRHFEMKAIPIMKVIDSLTKEEEKDIAFLNVDGLVFVNFLFENTYIYLYKKQIVIDEFNRKRTVKEILNYKYGTLTNLKEEILKREKDIFLLKDIDKFLKTDYEFYSKYFLPNDSVNITKMFINDLDSIVGLELFERKILTEKLLTERKILIKSNQYDSSNIYLQGYNITPILILYIDDDKVFRYVKHKMKSNFFRMQCREYLHDKFIKEKSEKQSFEEYLKSYAKKIFN